MKKTKSTRIFISILVWLFLSLGYFFLSETITAYLFPGIHEVGTWIMVLFAGLILIFTGTVISLIISCIKDKKAQL
jgi:hypothetical protein